jgi:hypothetical protein
MRAEQGSDVHRSVVSSGLQGVAEEERTAAEGTGDTVKAVTKCRPWELAGKEEVVGAEKEEGIYNSSSWCRWSGGSLTFSWCRVWGSVRNGRLVSRCVRAAHHSEIDVPHAHTLAHTHTPARTHTRAHTHMHTLTLQATCHDH